MANEARRIATLGIFRGTKMLMGVRKDNLAWTTPGGHMDAGEMPNMAAVREAFEETGLVLNPQSLQPLGRWKALDKNGKPLEIHPFRYNLDFDEQEVTVGLDKDDEVDQWFWVETKGGLPQQVLANLHSKRNALLMALGLQIPEEGISRFCIASPMPAARFATEHLAKGKWSSRVWKDQYGWNYELLFNGRPQGTKGACSDEKTARESAAECVQDAENGGYLPPER